MLGMFHSMKCWKGSRSSPLASRMEISHLRTLSTSPGDVDVSSAHDNARLKQKPRIAFIGGGNMAEAIIKGMLHQNIFTKDRVVVSDPNSSMYMYFEVYVQ
jgi:hypothetical protein